MPPAGESPPGRRRSQNLFALPLSPARRHRAQGDCLSRRGRGENASANEPRDLSVSRPMARLSRKQIVGHLSSGLSLAQPQRQRRGLERSTEGHGGPRAPSEKKQALVIHYGNSPRAGHLADLGRRRFHFAFFNASHRGSPFRV